MIGQSIEKLFPADRLQEETLILSRLQKGERVDHFETIRQRKDGKLIDVSLTISPIRNAEGTIIGASKIARDITEQKIAQRRLAEAHEALKRADQMKTEFLTTLSHELRTPLNAILGWIQILKDNASPEDLAEALPIMQQSARTQLQLIEDLLDMSRIENGRMILDIQPIDLATVVGASIDSVRPAADAKGIRLHSTLSSVGGTVMGDQNRIQQIFWNLLSNAIKFTPKGGRIHVIIQRVNSSMEISVADNGYGIAPEFLAHVFDRFRQADGTTTRRHGGLGLGLSIVKHLVELHGGTVRVSSEGQGKGATFTVSFPLQSARDESERTNLFSGPRTDDQPFRPDLAGVKVLVVDDEEESVSIVQRLLERRGAEVRGSRSMKAALGEFAIFSPHVVVSDIGMPEHDGYELISCLRALPEGKAVPAIALTALARNDDRTRALRAGFQMHLPKPVDFTELVAAVRNLAAIRRG
jgi:signal transduction histidine kinase